MKSFLMVILSIIGVLVMIGILIGWPLLAIASINTLFGTNIAYTALNWLAMTFLGIFFRGVKTTFSFNKE